MVNNIVVGTLPPTSLFLNDIAKILNLRAKCNSCPEVVRKKDDIALLSVRYHPFWFTSPPDSPFPSRCPFLREISFLKLVEEIFQRLSDVSRSIPDWSTLALHALDKPTLAAEQGIKFIHHRKLDVFAQLNSRFLIHSPDIGKGYLDFSLIAYQLLISTFGQLDVLPVDECEYHLFCPDAIRIIIRIYFLVSEIHLALLVLEHALHFLSCRSQKILSCTCRTVVVAFSAECLSKKLRFQISVSFLK